ncbi:tRNA (cytosine-5-)-methyltransferase [Mortierella polycephala]|uniref:tRNA (Cytosine-5-)-methyltransferase n=1 Tax=Mortierella polycephala TaxID=41804 RepID=A0A9P6PWQ7_9FUNG|nr:tRNA (cytosine-5-)-methyltransferase [Mortierella polycephala]
MTDIRALEFFSGIGGLHFGFNASGAHGSVLESFDMNQQANETYKLSFGKNPVSPYTRGGKLLDDQDNRAKPLLQLLNQLEKMKSPPTYLFLENVKNFETSRSRERLVTLLHKMGYVFRECLLAPYNFGVPNDRLRYFIMARLRSSFDKIAPSTHTPGEATQLFVPEEEMIYTSWPLPAFVEDPKKQIEQYPFTIPEIRHFLDTDESLAKDYMLSRQLILERPNFRFDILRPSSTRSSCFTKAYGSHHVASGGGLLQTQKMDQQEYDFENSESIADLGLRFFSPTEVARLHVFPLKEELNADSPFDTTTNTNPSNEQETTTLTTVRPFNPRSTQSLDGPFLQFPGKLKALQRYKLLGNSLNVWVVAELLRGVLFADHPGYPQPIYRNAEDDIGLAVTEPSGTDDDASAKHTIKNESGSTDDTQRDPKRTKVE